MDSRPVNHVTSISPAYEPAHRDAEQDKRKKRKKDHKAEPEDDSSRALPLDELGSQIDEVA